MSDYSDQINKALLAHGAWKQRLQSVVDVGTSEFSVSQVQVDNHCDFGKWFYGLPTGLRSTDHAGKIQTLHAEFHKEAARILDLALQGKKDQVQKALGQGEKYSLASGQLALALKQWERALADG